MSYSSICMLRLFSIPLQPFLNLHFYFKIINYSHFSKQVMRKFAECLIMTYISYKLNSLFLSIKTGSLICKNTVFNFTILKTTI